MYTQMHYGPGGDPVVGGVCTLDGTAWARLRREKNKKIMLNREPRDQGNGPCGVYRAPTRGRPLRSHGLTREVVTW